MSNLTCIECQNYAALSLQCRRNPPVPVIVGADANGAPLVTGMWPAVQTFDWCGEARRMTVVEVVPAVADVVA